MGINDFCAFDEAILAQTLAEATIDHAVELGNGVRVHFGLREGQPITIIENATGSLSGALYVSSE